MQSIKTLLNHNAFHEDVAILKALSQAHRYLGELKGIVNVLPNQAIIVNTLGLQEAQDSSAIENIITTQDELFKQLLNEENFQNPAVKEVTNYAQALHFLYEKQIENKFISMNMLIDAQAKIIGNNAGIRTQIGTVLKNEQTQKTIYTPPKPAALNTLLKDLEETINETKSNIDPLIKMAMIHYQFESIHPFYDGNGRIGRILNIIYLIHAGLLNTPILYLSRYINHNKKQYYHLLQTVRDNNNWQDWIIYMLNGVEKTAQSTIKTILAIKDLQQQYKAEIRTNHPKIYSQELLNNIFENPYTKIAFLQKDLAVSRVTARRYLEELRHSKLLEKRKLGRQNYYFNPSLIQLLQQTQSLQN